MKLYKKVLISTILVSACTLAFAQSSDAEFYEEEETSVESEYLSDIDDVEGEVIAALAKSEDLATKLTALKDLQEAIDGGNTSKAIIESLDSLAGEGVTSETRENGRLINNFPEVRILACQTMAKLPTEHSQKTLVKIAQQEKEPSVIAAAVQSLGSIGINVDETINEIAWASKTVRRKNPDSILAKEVLIAFEKLAEGTESNATLNAMIEETSKIASNYNYPLSIRNNALSLLKDLRGRTEGK